MDRRELILHAVATQAWAMYQLRFLITADLRGALSPWGSSRPASPACLSY